jgi:hypothetical protein
MDKEYAIAADRPVSELDRLYSELSHVHELIDSLESRLYPVTHHGVKSVGKLVEQATPSPENHISTAVAAANAAGNRLREIIDSLAV